MNVRSSFGVGEDHAERPVLRADHDAGAAADAVVGVQVRGLEARLVLEIGERERRVGEQRDHAERVVLVGVARAVEERVVRAEGRADGHAPAGGDLERAAVRDLQRQLDERASLAEEDQRIDAGERRLPELGDRGLLPVARLQLRPQPRHLRARARLCSLRRLARDGTAVVPSFRNVGWEPGRV